MFLLLKSAISVFRGVPLLSETTLSLPYRLRDDFPTASPTNCNFFAHKIPMPEQRLPSPLYARKWLSQSLRLARNNPSYAQNGPPASVFPRTTTPAPAPVPNPVPASPAASTVHYLLDCLLTHQQIDSSNDTDPNFDSFNALNRFDIHSSIGSYYGTISVDRGD